MELKIPYYIHKVGAGFPSPATDYIEDDVVNSVLEYTKGDGVDRVLEVEFGGNIPINQNIVKPNGTIAAYASATVMEPTLPFYNMMFKGIQINTFLIYSISKETRKMVTDGISKALNENAISHLIASAFTLDRVIDAHHAVENNNNIGNIIINIKPIN